MASQCPAARTLSVRLFGATRELGLLPTSVHSDVHTTVLRLTRLCNQRGKPIHLSAERTAKVDEALRAGGVFGGGVAELASAVQAWHDASHGEADAAGINSYYDAYRAEGYTAKLAGPQHTLTRRCVELAGLPLDAAADASPLLLVDLGCGSGLSMTPLETGPGTGAGAGAGAGARTAPRVKVLGLDLSFEMLKKARQSGCEVVQADISQPLPLRAGLFDGAISVSALQFLCQPAAGRPTSGFAASSPRRRACCALR